MMYSSLIGCVWLTAMYLSCHFNPLVFTDYDRTTLKTVYLHVDSLANHHHRVLNYSVRVWPVLERVFSRHNSFSCRNGTCITDSKVINSKTSTPSWSTSKIMGSISSLDNAGVMMMNSGATVDFPTKTPLKSNDLDIYRLIDNILIGISSGATCLGLLFGMFKWVKYLSRKQRLRRLLNWFTEYYIKYCKRGGDTEDMYIEDPYYPPNQETPDSEYQPIHNATAEYIPLRTISTSGGFDGVQPCSSSVLTGEESISSSNTTNDSLGISSNLSPFRNLAERLGEIISGKPKPKPIKRLNEQFNDSFYYDNPSYQGEVGEEEEIN